MKKVLLLTLALLPLAACGQTARPAATDVSQEAELVPTATAQALALQMEVQLNAQTGQGASALALSSQTSLTDQLVYDLNGAPLYHLTLVGPKVKDFWTTVIQQEGHSHFNLYGTGASTQRDFYSFVLNETSFPNFAKTRAAAGSFKRFVSPSGGILYLEDEQGRTWNLETATIIDPLVLAKQRDVFQSIVDNRRQGGVLGKLQESWTRYTNAANNLAADGTPLIGAQDVHRFPTLKSLTLPDGNLDIQRLAEALHNTPATAAGIRAQNENASCEGWFCAGMRYSSAVRKNPSGYFNENSPQSNDMITDDTGNAQYMVQQAGLSSDPKSDGGFWGAWDFGPGGIMNADFVGCGPMSVIRLFTWYGTERQNFPNPDGSYRPNINLVNGASALPAYKPDVSKIMMNPVYIGSRNGQNAYQPEIGTYTQSKFLINGVFTRDTDLVPGANRWIADKALDKNWELRGQSFALVNAGGVAVYSNPIGATLFSQYTWNVDKIVRDKIGRGNEPIIIMYATGRSAGLEGHIALSQAYLIHEGWFSANVLVWSTVGRDDYRQGSFINVTDAVSAYGGAWGLYQK